MLASKIVSGLILASDASTKAWFTNYVKGSTWFGCKAPIIKSVVQTAVDEYSRETNAAKRPKTTPPAPAPHIEYLSDAVTLLQCDECDAKLAGMLLLQLHTDGTSLATASALQALNEQVLLPAGVVADWSTADWFALKILETMWRHGGGNHDLARQILSSAHVPANGLWHRRTSVVAFVNWHKHRDKLPANFGIELVDACEANLLASPNERFTQTGVAWVLRYVLLQVNERDYAASVIRKHKDLWTPEAKKSLVEKLPKTHPIRVELLSSTKLRKLN